MAAEKEFGAGVASEFGKTTVPRRKRGTGREAVTDLESPNPGSSLILTLLQEETKGRIGEKRNETRENPSEGNNGGGDPITARRST